MRRKPRRTVLRLAGSAAVGALAGCSSDGGTDSNGTENGGSTGSETATDKTQRETRERTANSKTRSASTTSETSAGETAAGGTPALSGPVPDVYRTATSLGGTERNPDSLQPKNAVQYQSQPKNGQQCSGCMFYIPDKNGDGLGACSIVQGYIEPKGWCVSYSPYQNG